MKGWLKALLWFGLGAGIGFFAGYGTGSRVKDREEEEAYDQGRTDGYSEARSGEAEYKAGMDEYRKGEMLLERMREISKEMWPEDSDPEMPEEPPVIGDEETIGDTLPSEPKDGMAEMHPEYMTPVQITEEEYYANPWGDTQESLIFYELDEVLLNKETRAVLKTKNEIDQVIGIGMTFQFYLKDGEALDAIFVRNPTIGTVFRIDRMDASYEDTVYGEGAPEYEEDDDTE